jgi:prepilin peptidase CpaA
MKSIFFVTGILVVVAAILDVYTRKIPNLLTVPAVLAGLVWNLSLYGWRGALSSFLGLCLGMGVLLVFYVLGGMGAGDVKLLGAVGALVGPQQVFYALILTALVGGVLALAYVIIKRAFSQTVFNLKGIVLSLPQVFIGGGLKSMLAGDRVPLERQNSIAFPYGVAIATGTLLSFLV